MQEYQRLNKARMTHLQQRAKAEWLKGRDENSAYFHACLKKIRVQNKVYRIQNIEVEWRNDSQGIESICAILSEPIRYR